MDLKTKIKNRDDFSLKFNDAPFNTNGILNPGWAEPTYDEIEDSIPATFRLSFFTSRGINPKNCRRFHVIGDSMEPIIMSNDCITVDCSPIDHIENNQIYALYYEHSLKVKRLIKTFKSLIIHSENPAYPDEELTLEEADQLIHIIGRVIERSGSI